VESLSVINRKLAEELLKTNNVKTSIQVVHGKIKHKSNITYGQSKREE
jgi:hypothetical protein